MESFRIQHANQILKNLCARLLGTRWPDQIPGIGREQGTELEWFQRRVSYWANEFDWRACERRLNSLNHFIWVGIHFMHQRAMSKVGCDGRNQPARADTDAERRHAMNRLLWASQVLTELLDGALGVMKVFMFDKVSEGVPSSAPWEATNANHPPPSLPR